MACEKVAVGARIILRPNGEPLVPVAAPAREARAGDRRDTSGARRPTRSFPDSRRARGNRCTRCRDIRGKADGSPSGFQPRATRRDRCEETDCESPHGLCPEDSTMPIDTNAVSITVPCGDRSPVPGGKARSPHRDERASQTGRGHAPARSASRSTPPRTSHPPPNTTRCVAEVDIHGTGVRECLDIVEHQP